MSRLDDQVLYMVDGRYDPVVATQHMYGSHLAKVWNACAREYNHLERWSVDKFTELTVTVTPESTCEIISVHFLMWEAVHRGRSYGLLCFASPQDVVAYELAMQHYGQRREAWSLLKAVMR